ncbi:hypothetical protein LWC34_54850 [Kibdelosporangium philippinense]|uniref:PH domain-containing protein n=1 Tax=Kibdelosporangium philippinense TaxID=211113 RepID=A0ABS8ZVV8_9PSEU|nr:hypothetical protein [Kibdelosporangium philippinense]MCE7011837.1 hypothetical protein [Kibdelosporangium philippinense]
MMRLEMPGMPSSNRTTWVAEWGQPRRAKWYAGLAWLALLALVAFASAGVAATGEMTGAVKYLLLFGVLFVIIIVVGFDSRINLRKHGASAIRNQSGAGLVIPYSRIGFIGSALMMVMLVVIFAAASYDFARNVEGDVTSPIAAAIVFGLIAAFFATYPLQIVTGKIARGKVILTPSGIEHRSWGYQSRLSWDDVVHVSAINGDGPQIWLRANSGAVETTRFARIWGGRPRDNSGIAIEGKNLFVDPALVYRMVSFYVSNRTARTELGAEAALQRARTSSYSSP